MKRNIILSILFIVLVAGWWFFYESRITDINAPEIESSSDVATETEYPLYITTMTHMELGFSDDKDERMFNTHVDELRYGMDLAEEYDAVLTIESEKPFARANTIWGENIMKEILERGHGVGTHCDLGPRYTDTKMTAAEYAKSFAENKKLVDDLVGAENNHGCSGGAGVNDWLTAAKIAGFDYVNGIVAWHVLPIPYENRPDTIWTDEYLESEHFHDPVPQNLADRIYLMKLKDLQDFEDDEDGEMVIANGDVGGLSTQDDTGYFDDRAEITMADVDAFLATVKEVDSYRDKTRVAKLNLYLPVNTFEPENEEVLRYFFSEMKKLQDEGIVQWASQWDVVQIYLGEKDPDSLTKLNELSSGDESVSSEDFNELADVYTMFTLNVHDWVYPDNSAETVNRVIDIHEKYNVPVDIYITDPVFQKYVANYPDLVERLKTSSVVAVSYHSRAPAPYTTGFDDIGGLNKMDEEELHDTLTNYEEHKLDLETGLPLDGTGGYQLMKDTLGYAPVVTGISISGDIGNMLALVYQDKGAEFVAEHDIVDLGDKKYGVYARPEHSEVKLYEMVRGYEGGEDVFAEALAQAGEAENSPQFINFKYHENNFYLEGTPFWPVYWEDENKSRPKKPPFDISIHNETPDFRSQNMQDKHWALYENTVKYTSEHMEEFNPINAFDLVEMLLKVL